jgi:hypothetical protein
MATEYSGGNAASSRLIPVWTGSPGVAGSPVEFFASTVRENYWITLSVAGNDGDTATEVILSVGATPVEKFRISFWNNGVNTSGRIMIPYTIPANSRVTLSALGNKGPREVQCSLALSDNASFGTSTEVTLMGATNGVGATLDPGPVALQKGDWEEIVGSVPHDCNYLVVCLGENANDAVSGNFHHLVDIGVGPAGVEVPLIEEIRQYVNGSEIAQTWYQVFENLTAGDRLVARCQCDNVADATDRLIDISVVGINIIPPAGGGPNPRSWGHCS